MATMTADLDRIAKLGVTRNASLARLADIDRELKKLCITAVRFGCASTLIAQFAGISREKIDRWVQEERRV